MPTKQQTPQKPKQPTAPSFIPRTPVFPPLPPLPPPDTCISPKTTRKASASVDPRPRLFGVKITNLLGAHEGSSNAQRADHKAPRSLAMAAAQRYFHQYQYHSHSGNKAQVAREESMNDKGCNLPAEGPTVPKAQDCPKKSPVQPGCSIWSVTPEELAELAKEMAATKMVSTELGRKLTYAEASKRNLAGSADDRAVQKTEVTEVDQPVRVFKKYYGLPDIPSYDPPNSMDTADTLEEKDTSEEPAGSFSKNVSSTALQYSQLLGLSADTPTFYPRQTDTNDVIRVALGLHSQLKASLTSKKVAPHMDWWPAITYCFLSVVIFLMAN
ncbi:hypothetical protein V7S43_017196 [Phytophthora oleae]|uniref:Uncharacterized protein n=1 Tax=Phytophthora oleae TaxID=2107226 RepID=A0ABD3EVU2_9STRA